MVVHNLGRRAEKAGIARGDGKALPLVNNQRRSRVARP